MKSLTFYILLLMPLLSRVVIASEKSISLYADYMGHLKLESLASHLDKTGKHLQLRLISEESDKIVSYTFKAEIRAGELFGNLSVLSRFSGKANENMVNVRDLSAEESRKIIEIVNRRELLFLPNEFTEILTDPFPKNMAYVVEIVATEPSRTNVLMRSILQTDAVQELKDWLVAIANSPNDKWHLENSEKTKK